jgi:hypothetical protein
MTDGSNYKRSFMEPIAICQGYFLYAAETVIRYLKKSS